MSDTGDDVYGFRVRLHDGEYDFDEEWELALVPAGQWSVLLPHQCDAWVIAEKKPQIEAVAALETFIAEAQVALEALRRGEERNPW